MPLVLAGAPIGRSDDASPRLAAALATADVVAAEDTRRLHRLCADLGIELTGRVVSYFEGNEAQRTASLLDALRAGERVVVVTDAGMPTVSDPGYRLVVAAAEQGLPVTCVPGPSAVTTALAVSGLPTDRFCFEGFLPRKAGSGAPAGRAAGRAAHVRAVRGAAPAGRRARRHGRRARPERRAVVCRELTKTYEEVVRGTCPSCRVGGRRVRGEVTLVLEGRPSRPSS
jgi:16S rRNA (cytidine1402-2'-O)-methyltransferase